MEPMNQDSYGTEKRMAGEHAAEYEMSAAPERNDDERIEEMEEGIEPNEAQAAREDEGKGEGNTGSHREGQYDKQSDKPTMRPGKSI